MVNRPFDGQSSSSRRGGGRGSDARAHADPIGPVPVIDQRVAWDRERCRLSPGERILALGLHVLTDRPPLYSVTDVFWLAEVPLFLGPGETEEHLTGDARGRAFHKLAAAEPPAVFSAVTVRTSVAEAIERGGMPADTTSHSLEGGYPPPTGKTPTPCCGSRRANPAWSHALNS